MRKRHSHLFFFCREKKTCLVTLKCQGAVLVNTFNFSPPRPSTSKTATVILPVFSKGTKPPCHQMSTSAAVPLRVAPASNSLSSAKFHRTGVGERSFLNATRAPCPAPDTLEGRRALLTQASVRLTLSTLGWTLRSPISPPRTLRPGGNLPGGPRPLRG